MKQIDSVVSSILSSYKAGLYPYEERLKMPAKRNNLTIGVPKEIEDAEERVAITPEGVETFVSEGYKVLIEKDAGLLAKFSDLDYAESGATIVNSPQEAFSSDIVVKINHPQQFEVDMMGEGKVLLSNLFRNAPAVNSFKAMMRKKLTAVAIECVNDHMGKCPIRNSIFPIEGKAVMLLAAELLSNERGGRGTLLGGLVGIAPVEVVILGAGTIAEHAAQVAIALGANVKIFSTSLDSMSNLKQKIGQSLFTCLLHKQSILKAFETADVIINTHDFEDKDTLFTFNEDMFSVMKKGTVVLDMSVKAIGCFNSGQYQIPNKSFNAKYGIIYHCVVNVSSRVSHTASMAISNVLTSMVLKIACTPSISQLLRQDKGFRDGVYIMNGILTYPLLGRTYNLPYQEIDLLLAAF